jgi:DNA-binding LacI/PurR family transcriptional regulator
MSTDEARAVKRRPTLADVAARTGVSAKTVSNVLLGRPQVSAATREAVLAAVAEVGYAVNPAGRGLASGRTGRVAVTVPNLYQPYFAEIAERLILALEEHGLTTTLRLAPDGAAERAAVLGTTTRDVDGVVICPHALTAEMLDVPPPRPVVQLGGGRMPLLDRVVMGERPGAEAMTRHLLESGRRRIAIVWNGPPGVAPSGDRFEGYLAALEAFGVPRDESLFVSGVDWNRRASGYEAMVGLLRSGVSFDAALCVNDAIAVGVLRALRSHGRRVPEDVAVTGFDDTDEGEFTTPSLSSVSPEQGEMVAAAVRMLLERIAGYAGPAREVHTGAHLVLRASSATR